MFVVNISDFYYMKVHCELKNICHDVKMKAVGQHFL